MSTLLSVTPFTMDWLGQKDLNAATTSADGTGIRLLCQIVSNLSGYQEWLNRFMTKRKE